MDSYLSISQKNDYDVDRLFCENFYRVESMIVSKIDNTNRASQINIVGDVTENRSENKEFYGV
ncbi:hypothetical protein ACEF17_04735 [Streptococcus hyovaginalis]